MKFLIVAPRFHTNLYYRAKALQDAGHTVKVIVLYQGKSEFYETIDIQVLRLSAFSRLLSSIIKIFKKTYLKSGLEFRLEAPDNQLNKIFKTYLPDVVLLKAYQNLLAIKTLIVAKKYKANVLMLTQTPYNHIKGSQLLFKLNMKLFRSFKVFAFITPIKINYDIFKKSGIENVHYLPFVYPKVLNIEDIKQSRAPIKIISVGKFVRRKDQILLLKALLRLKKENFNLQLTLIGEIADENYYQEVLKFINDKNLQTAVTIKTNIAYNRMDTEYQKHDLFVLTSYEEPAAYSIVEAMANGLAVICSDENGTQNYIEQGKNGFIFKAKNTNDLHEKIKLCIADKKRLQAIQQTSIKLHYENHLPKQFANIISSIVKN